VDLSRAGVDQGALRVAFTLQPDHGQWETNHHEGEPDAEQGVGAKDGLEVQRVRGDGRQSKRDTSLPDCADRAVQPKNIYQ
jgi:hypothetical protein